MKINVGKFLGAAHPKGWAQVYDFSPEQPEKMAARGRLVAIISLPGLETKEGVEMVATGRELVGRLHELYYGEIESSPMDCLRGVLARIKEEFEGVEVAGVATIGETIYLGVTGVVGIWAKIGESGGWVVMPEAERINQVRCFGGKVSEGEMLVLGNSRFWETVPIQIVKAAVEEVRQGMEAVVDGLATAERGRETSGCGAALILQFKEVGKDIVMSEKTEPVGRTAVSGSTTNQPQEERNKEDVRKADGWLGGGRGLMDKIKNKIKISENVYVGQNTNLANRRKPLVMGLGFLVVLGLLVLVGHWRLGVVAEKNSKQTELIESLSQQFKEAKGVAGLNPTRSKELLALIKQEMDSLPEAAKKDKEVMSIQIEMGEVLGVASGTKQAAFKEVTDLGLQRDGVDAIGVVRVDGVLGVLDGAGSRLFTVDAKKGSVKVLAGRNDLGTGVKLAGYPDKVEVLSDKGVVECVLSKSQCGLKIVKDPEWKKVVGIAIWASNVYLMDAEAGKLWRYPGTEDGFGIKQSWLAEGSPMPAQASEMTIDGSVWVWANGQLYKYVRGVKDTFNIGQMDLNFLNSVAMATEDDSDKIYILDKDNKRVVAILKQTGEYVSQWVGDKFGLAKGIAVDETAGKMYVVGGRYVWEVSL